MTVKKIGFFLLLVLSAAGISAQDIHFTMYNMAPLSLNPALTGAFEGTARVGGVYRDQWASFLDNQFVTPYFYVDAPLMRGLRDQDWIGVGGMLINDKAGTSELQTNMNMLSAAYHFALDKSGKQYLTLGVQGGNVSRRMNLQSPELKFADELDMELGGGGLGIGNGADRQIGEELSYLDFNTGLMYRSQMDEDGFLEIGLSINHITQPRNSFTGGGSTPGNPNPADNESKRDMRLALHGRYNRPLTDKWSVEPSFLIQSTEGTTEFVLQAVGGYQLNEDFRLHAGPGYRAGDAGQILLGVTHKEDLRVMLSYDVNVSSLSEVSNFQGGFELGAYYIFKIYKKPEINPAILCPRL